MTTDTDLNDLAYHVVDLGRRRDHLEAQVNFLAREIADTASTVGTETVVFEGLVIAYRNAKADLIDITREHNGLLS